VPKTPAQSRHSAKPAGSDSPGNLFAEFIKFRPFIHDQKESRLEVAHRSLRRLHLFEPPRLDRVHRKDQFFGRLGIKLMCFRQKIDWRYVCDRERNCHACLTHLSCCPRARETEKRRRVSPRRLPTSSSMSQPIGETARKVKSYQGVSGTPP
jgi:hypothetical protein